jgi:2'-5' RNA ligase
MVSTRRSPAIRSSRRDRSGYIGAEHATASSAAALEGRGRWRPDTWLPLAARATTRSVKQRMFIGIELSAAARTAIASAIAARRARGALPEGLRVLDAETWHVTLQFLGDVQDTQLDAVIRACSAALAPHPGFAIELAAAGAAPGPRKARVLWVELGRGRDDLGRLARSLAAATRPLGFEPEARDFKPHVTWARAKQPIDSRAIVGAFEVDAVTMPVRDAVLYRSLRSDTGARYEVVQRLALRGARA